MERIIINGGTISGEVFGINYSYTVKNAVTEIKTKNYISTDILYNSDTYYDTEGYELKAEIKVYCPNSTDYALLDKLTSFGIVTYTPCTGMSFTFDGYCYGYFDYYEQIFYVNIISLNLLQNTDSISTLSTETTIPAVYGKNLFGSTAPIITISGIAFALEYCKRSMKREYKENWKRALSGRCVSPFALSNANYDPVSDTITKYKFLPYIETYTYEVYIPTLYNYNLLLSANGKTVTLLPFGDGTITLTPYLTLTHILSRNNYLTLTFTHNAFKHITTSF